MKTRQIWAAGALLVTTLISGTLHAQDTEFILANDTAFTVYAVYIWPFDESYRGPDRLGRGVIASGESRTFAPTNGHCLYNVRVRLEDREKRWDDVDLCELTILTLHYNYVTRDLYASGN